MNKTDLKDDVVDFLISLEKSGYVVRYLNSYIEQAKGLMFKVLPSKFCYVFNFKKQDRYLIHTWFMFGSIDIVLYNDLGIVVGMYENVKPWNIIIPKVRYKLMMEFEPGFISKNMKR